MSFTQQFLAGQQMAENAMNAFQTARRQRDIRRVTDEQPTMGLAVPTADREALAAAINPETGRPFYDLEDDGQGGVRVRSNFEFAGADGGMVPAGAHVAAAPQRMTTKFLGRRHEGTLDDAQIAGLRMRGIADVETRFDPVRGLELRAAADRQDRERIQFANQQTVFGQGQQDRAAAERLVRDRRAFVQGLQGLDGPALAQQLGGSFSRDGSGVDAMLTFDEKTRRFVLASNVPGVPTQTLSKPELIQAAVGLWEMGNGDFQRGLEMSIATAAQQRALDTANWNRAAQVAEAQQGAFQANRLFDAQQRHFDAKHGIERARLGLASAEAAHRRAPNMIPIQLADGSVGWVPDNMLPTDQATGIRTLPPGTRLIPGQTQRDHILEEREKQFAQWARENAGATPQEAAQARRLFGLEPFAGSGVQVPEGGWAPHTSAAVNRGASPTTLGVIADRNAAANAAAQQGLAGAPARAATHNANAAAQQQAAQHPFARAADAAIAQNNAASAQSLLRTPMAVRQMSPEQIQALNAIATGR